MDPMRPLSAERVSRPRPLSRYEHAQERRGMKGNDPARPQDHRAAASVRRRVPLVMVSVPVGEFARGGGIPISYRAFSPCVSDF